jgi:hypothetical protein
MKQFPLLIAGLLAGGLHAAAQSCDCPPIAERTPIVVTDEGAGTGSTTWTCNNIYLLDGYVFVNDGQALTIEAGTVVKGMNGSGADAAAMIVARGGQLFAEGSADCPIVFTHEADPLDGSVAFNERGQWGGVLVLGDAPINLALGEGQAEGIPSENDRSSYGGTNPEDNSGVLRYVSIRHGGTQLGAANEINGLTLAGVGSGTTIDHIEVLANEDDGIEFFGGTVQVNYAAVAFVGDDSFDWDQGFSGGGHHWFAINEPGIGDRGGELDGDDSPDVTPDGMPMAIPTVSNITLMGQGSAANKQGLLFRAGTGGHVSEVLMVGFGEGIELEDLQAPSDAFDMWVNGDLTLVNIGMDDVNEVIDYDGVMDPGGDSGLDQYAENNNIGALETGIDNAWSTNATGTEFTDPFNPVPNGNASVFSQYGYMGAFDPYDAENGNWLAGWSYLDESGALVPEFQEPLLCDCPPVGAREEILITDNGSGTGTTTWTCDKTYLLDGFVFVSEGQTLTIEPGTIVKGMEGSGAEAAALIVTRGAQILAEGTETCPITFTFEADPLDGSVSFGTSGQWGGLIVCGNAPNNLATGEGQVEGIPSDNAQSAYGGNNPADNSGILRYVSIRHGGTQLAAANEINGLTLASVGNGTVIDHIEIVSNEDDGIELFGGTVNISHIAVLFAGDDSFDYDQGWSGNGQFLFAVQHPEAGDRAGEFDGDDNPNVTPDGLPYADPTLYNVTFIGRGSDAGTTGTLFRAGSAGDLHNSLITGFNRGIELEDVQSPLDAYDHFVNGDLGFSHIGFMDVNTLFYYDGSEADGQTTMDTYAAANDLMIMEAGIDHTFAFDASGTYVEDAMMVNPVMDVAVGADALPSGAWFVAADYKGAFEPCGTNWLDLPWSFANQVGLFDASCTWYGCTNEAACNYDELATNDDGSCNVLADGTLTGSLEVQPGAVEGYTYEPVLGDLAWTVENGTASSTTTSSFDITWADPFDGGSITLTESDSTGCTNTVTWTILNVGIDGIDGAEARIYPNPTSDFLTVEQVATAFRYAVLRDELGRVVAELTMAPGVNRFDIGHLTEGMYYLTLQTLDGEETSTHRLVIQ